MGADRSRGKPAGLDRRLFQYFRRGLAPSARRRAVGADIHSTGATIAARNFSSNRHLMSTIGLFHSPPGRKVLGSILGGKIRCRGYMRRRQFITLVAGAVVRDVGLVAGMALLLAVHLPSVTLAQD